METKKSIKKFEIAKSFIVGFAVGFTLYKFFTILVFN